MDNISKSQIATSGSKIENSNIATNDGNISFDFKAEIRKAKRESAIISFIVSTLSAIIASYLYEKFLK